MVTAIGQQTSWGMAKESTFGTPVVTSRFHRISGEGQGLAINYIEDDAWEPGGYNPTRGDGRVESTRIASGDVTTTVYSRGMGLLLEQIFGGSPDINPLGGSPAAYEHVFALGLLATSMTTQKVIRDNAGNALGAFTYPGTKVTKAEFSIATNAMLKAVVSLFSREERKDIAAAAASYIAGNPFTFKQGTLKFNGTAIADTVKGCTITIERPFDTEDHGLGRNGLVGSLDENAKPVISGTIDSEFANVATYYDRFVGNTSLEMELLFEGATISGSNKETFKLTVPDVRLSDGSPKVGGPGKVTANIPFSGFYNGTDPAITATVITLDAAL
jgi:hypothetical protein